MFRLASLASVMPIAICFAAAPVPKDAPKKDALYFPTQVGTKWVTKGADGSEQTWSVTAAEHKAKEELWVVSVGLVKDGKPGPVEEWEVSKHGLVQTKFLGDKEREPMRFLKLPHKAQEKWPFGPEEIGFVCVALPARKMRVPAGEFEVIGVEKSYKGKLATTHWFAPGVGMVAACDDRRTLFEMTSFTPGKD